MKFSWLIIIGDLRDYKFFFFIKIWKEIKKKRKREREIKELVFLGFFF